jgi:hypothetical protein
MANTQRRGSKNPRRRSKTGTGRQVDEFGLVRLCDRCSIDYAREWHKTPAGGSVCDQCWRRRFG